jgi:hypothetical protein
MLLPDTLEIIEVSLLSFGPFQKHRGRGTAKGTEVRFACQNHAFYEKTSVGFDPPLWWSVRKVVWFCPTGPRMHVVRDTSDDALNLSIGALGISAMLVTGALHLERNTVV